MAPFIGYITTLKLELENKSKSFEICNKDLAEAREALAIKTALLDKAESEIENEWKKKVEQLEKIIVN